MAYPERLTDVQNVSRETWPDQPELERLISSEASDAGVRLSKIAVRGMAAHLYAVHAHGKNLNLTAIDDPKDAVRLHVVDSLMTLRDIPKGHNVVCDLGSGAGFPGLPLALASSSEVLLLEATKKKARFLEETISIVGVANASVRAERAEELAAEAPGTFDIVICRAVANLAALVELAAPLLRVGGRLLAMKGTPSTVELEHGDRAARMCGMRKSEIRKYTLSGGERRALVVYERVGDFERDLPRRTGMAQKKPLG